MMTPLLVSAKKFARATVFIWGGLKSSSSGQNYAKHKQPLEAIGTAYYESYQRGFVDEMPLYASNMK